MGSFSPLVEKEVKDLLRDPRIYIGLLAPILIMPIIGLAMSAAMQSSIETISREGVKVAVIDSDRTVTSREFIGFMRSLDLNVSEAPSVEVEDAIEKLKDVDVRILIVIPSGFESNVTSFRKAQVNVYFIIKSMGLSAIGIFSIVENVLNAYSRALAESFISSTSPEVNPEDVLNPLTTVSYTIVKNKVLKVSPGILFNQFFTSSGIIVPMVLMLVSITVAQIAATATAVENEEKTLETLLTLPISRYSILMGKLIGSTVVAMLGTILFIVGLTVYFQSLFSLPIMAGEGLTVSLEFPTASLESYIMLFASLLIAIFFATSLGVIIGALSSDVRISGSLVGFVQIPIMIPMFIVIYGDIRSLPLALQLFIYALPPSYPMLIAQSMFFSELPFETLLGIPYSAVFTVFLIYLTSKLLVSEKLLSLQYKLLTRKMKGRVTP
ncbi:ABC transporter permease [Candidatus Bathyarchaeota archaeon]|nr:ABC transporter permease [Candidatus Bathyarchaeota archaeon]MBS7613631.1 ABC transporter permease [Candidatus Bathyarchaeota archaeon]MBS7618578.1 ABC transporter permease [Candidatus Bathyarchaeota archaeon]